MSSVAYTDLAIGLLATFTLCLALPVLVHNNGGWSAVHAALPSSHFRIFGDIHPINSYIGSNILPDGTRERISSAMELFLPTCLLMLGNQSMYQKFFSAKSEKDATRAVIGWIIGTILLESVIVALAVAGSAHLLLQARSTTIPARSSPTSASTGSRPPRRSSPFPTPPALPP